MTLASTATVLIAGLSAAVVLAVIVFVRRRYSQRFVLKVSTQRTPSRTAQISPEWIYEVSLEFRSRTEVSSSSFDHGRPMRIVIDPPSRIEAGLPRYNGLEGESIYADPTGHVPGLLSAVEIMPQTIHSGMRLAFAVRNRDAVTFNTVDAPARVAVRRGLNQRQRQSLEVTRDYALVVIGVIAFIVAVAAFFG